VDKVVILPMIESSDSFWSPANP